VWKNLGREEIQYSNNKYNNINLIIKRNILYIRSVIPNINTIHNKYIKKRYIVQMDPGGEKHQVPNPSINGALKVFK
jgi:hypothetical protein